MENNFRDKVVEELTKKFNDKVSADEGNSETVIVDKGIIVDVAKELRDKHNLKLLVNLTGVDYPENFAAIYRLASAEDFTHEVSLKVLLPKDKPEIASLTAVFQAADVQERETWDLMGITYKGHPNLVRILTTDDFEGHPLRKDFKG